MINSTRVVLGTVAYTAGTFTLAVVWHVVLFEDQYLRFGYFEGEPSFVLGFITILLQGALLSLLFPLFRLSGTAIRRGLKFAALIGAFFWTSHVLAFVAKQTMVAVPQFVVMETLYLALQFGLFGVFLGLIYKGESPP